MNEGMKKSDFDIIGDWINKLINEWMDELINVFLHDALYFN